LAANVAAHYAAVPTLRKRGIPGYQARTSGFKLAIPAESRRGLRRLPNAACSAAADSRPAHAVRVGQMWIGFAALDRGGDQRV